ncbi:MAG: CPBP family intramembrane glutamic endopeptidase [bacterium]
MNSDNYNDNLSKQEDGAPGQGPGLKPVISPIGAAFFGLIGIFILYQIGGSLVTYLIFGMDLNNADINALRLMTMGGQILFILFPTILLAKLFYINVTNVLRFYPAKLMDIVIFVLGLVILTPLMHSYLYLQNYFIEKISEWSSFFNEIKVLFDQMDSLLEETYESLMNVSSPVEGILIVLVVAVVPALCEETFFRGYVQRSFEQKLKPFLSAAITAFFFSLYHFSPYGLPALFILGLYIGFSAYMTNSIYVPMSLHFLNNLFAVFLYFTYGNEEILATNLVKKDDLLIAVILFLSLSIIFVVFISLVKKYFTKKRGAK